MDSYGVGPNVKAKDDIVTVCVVIHLMSFVVKSNLITCFLM
ncbi:hypothetical protein MtrunA17_Chr3g0104641 [Medicago truncatula]|uniref:Transmembrane protein n=1 Tax=Medicago truncatula TaxID=3880 RepID=A0A396IQJ5_MEDTR|nr:hypothetical protein MtrunA17_Chr3g0104641 [Medicago truncatula]